MRWIKIESAMGVRDEFAAAPPIDRATWIALYLYCGIVENGGRIKECRKWPDHVWQQAARVTAEAVQRETRLWHWDGNDLAVHSYPAEDEAAFRAYCARKREAKAQTAAA
jgi:hypothetical protein